MKIKLDENLPVSFSRLSRVSRLNLQTITGMPLGL